MFRCGVLDTSGMRCSIIVQQFAREDNKTYLGVFAKLRLTSAWNGVFCLTLSGLDRCCVVLSESGLRENEDAAKAHEDHRERFVVKG